MRQIELAKSVSSISLYQANGSGMWEEDQRRAQITHVDDCKENDFIATTSAITYTHAGGGGGRAITRGRGGSYIVNALNLCLSSYIYGL